MISVRGRNFLTVSPLAMDDRGYSGRDEKVLGISKLPIWSWDMEVSGECLGNGCLDHRILGTSGLAEHLDNTRWELFYWNCPGRRGMGIVAFPELLFPRSQVNSPLLGNLSMKPYKKKKKRFSPEQAQQMVLLCLQHRESLTQQKWHDPCRAGVSLLMTFRSFGTLGFPQWKCHYVTSAPVLSEPSNAPGRSWADPSTSGLQKR